MKKLQDCPSVKFTRIKGIVTTATPTIVTKQLQDLHNQLSASMKRIYPIMHSSLHLTTPNPFGNTCS